ncbi:MAG: hypothetical protein WDM96_08535 [Lacunisphaera sp.]
MRPTTSPATWCSTAAFSGSPTASKNAHLLPGATLTLNGGRLWGGAISNQVIFGGDFEIGNTASGSTSFIDATPGVANAGDNIELTADRTITASLRTASGTGRTSSSAPGRNLTGPGKLTLAGAWTLLRISSDANTFSGGLDSRAPTTLNGGGRDLVFGALADPARPNEGNFLGIGRHPATRRHDLRNGGQRGFPGQHAAPIHGRRQLHQQHGGRAGPSFRPCAGSATNRPPPAFSPPTATSWSATLPSLSSPISR